VVAMDGEHPAAYAGAVLATLVVAGRPRRAASLFGHLGRAVGPPAAVAPLLDALLERLARRGVEVAFVAAPDELRPALAAGGFAELARLHARHLYLGLDGVSPRLGARTPNPMRALATEARRIRSKLAEMPLDRSALEHAARLLAARAEDAALAVARTPEELEWRFLRDPRRAYRLLVYRSKAGQGLDGLAVVRRALSARGRPVLAIEDHWTREPGRRAQARLAGELAFLALAEGADVLRGFAAAGSATEQALLGIGCIRRKVDRAFMVRGLGAPGSGPALDARAVRLAAADVELDLP
jgi:hypothetical protein